MQSFRLQMWFYKLKLEKGTHAVFKICRDMPYTPPFNHTLKGDKEVLHAFIRSTYKTSLSCTKWMYTNTFLWIKIQRDGHPLCIARSYIPHYDSPYAWYEVDPSNPYMDLGIDAGNLMQKSHQAMSAYLVI